MRPNDLLTTAIDEYVARVNNTVARRYPSVQIRLDANTRHVVDRLCDRYNDPYLGVKEVMKSVSRLFNGHYCELVYFSSLKKKPRRIELLYNTAKVGLTLNPTGTKITIRTVVRIPHTDCFSIVPKGDQIYEV